MSARHSHQYAMTEPDGCDAGATAAAARPPAQRRLAVAIAALLSGAPLAAAAGAGQGGPSLLRPAAPYTPNLEAQLQVDGSRVLGGLDLVAPLWQDPWLLSYAEIKGYASDRQTMEMNLGLGLRRLDREGRFILGAFAQYDRRNTDFGNTFSQATLGLEALGNRFDARANWYHPFEGARRVQGWVGGVQFQGFRTFTQETFEEPLGGWDGELGVLLPIKSLEVRLYAGGYGLHGDLSGSVTGWTARLELRPIKSLSLELGYREDGVFGAQTAFTLRYAFGLPAERGIRTLRERMTETTRRDLDNLVSPPDLTPRQSVVLTDNTLHIDAARGRAGGDGSYEHPYTSVDACVQARCAGAQGGVGGPGALVRLWAGGSSAELPYRAADTWRLRPGQTLWGEGWRVEPAPTRAPVYAGWLERGTLDLGRAPWFSPPAGRAGIALADGSGLLGVAVDVRSGTSAAPIPAQPSVVQTELTTPLVVQTEATPPVVVQTALPTPPPTVVADGSAAFTVRGNLLLADQVGVEVRQLRAGIGAGAGSTLTLAGLSAPGAAVGWALPDGTPIQGRILDNLVVLASPVSPGAAPGAAVALVNLAQGGAESRQVILFRGTDPRPGLSAPAGADLSLRAENRAEGAGSRAVQEVLILDADLNLADHGISITNSAVAGAAAIQDIRLLGGHLSGQGGLIRAENRAADGATADQTLVIAVADAASFRAGLDGRNLADGAGAAAIQRIQIDSPLTLTGVTLVNQGSGGASASQGVRLTGVALAEGGDSGLALFNQAAGAGQALQGVAIRGQTLDLSVHGIYAANSADSLGQATQQVEVIAEGGAGAARLDLGNEARAGGTAVQQADLTGVALGATGGWLGIVNGAFGQASASQRVRLADLGLALPGGGVFIGNGAYVDSSATQAVQLAATGQGGLSWFSADNQAELRSAADQRITAAGFALAQDGTGKGGIETWTDAYTQSRVNQAIALDLTAVDLPGGGLDARVHAQDGAQAAQGLDLRLGGGSGLKTADLRGDAANQSVAVADLQLTLAGGAGIGTLDARNQAVTDSQSRQGLRLSGDGAGPLGDLLLTNGALTRASAGQTLDGSALPLLNDQGRFRATNTASGEAQARQDTRLNTAASPNPGAKPFQLTNQADTGGAAGQTLAVSGAADPGRIGAVKLGNTASDATARALQQAEFQGAGLSGAYRLFGTGDSLTGIDINNWGDGGQAVQRLSIAAGDLALDAASLQAGNQARSGGLADQTLALRGAPGLIGWLGLSNAAESAAVASQQVAVAGPDLANLVTINNGAVGAGTAAQQVALAPRDLNLASWAALTVGNSAVSAGAADQSLELRVTRAFSLPEPTAVTSEPALTLLNTALDTARAAQSAVISAQQIDLPGRGIGVTNAADQTGTAGQQVAISALEGARRIGSLTMTNAAAGGAAAVQGMAVEGLAVDALGSSGDLALGNSAAGGARAVQDLAFGGALQGGAIGADDSASGLGSSAEQSLTLNALMPSMVHGLALSADASAGGTADQSAVIVGIDSIAPGAAAQVLASGDAGTARQVVELRALGLRGGTNALAITAAATAAGDLTQQVTLRDARLQGGAQDILVDPGAPTAGQVAQHLALWATPAAVRFEPLLIRDLADLAGITQTWTIDGVRQTIWRRLVLPTGVVVWVGEGGTPGAGPGIGSGSWSWSGSGSVTTDTGWNVIPWIVIDGRRPPNLGDFLSQAAGDLVYGLSLPAGAGLSPGALRYYVDLSGRRAAGAVPALLAIAPAPLP